MIKYMADYIVAEFYDMQSRTNELQSDTAIAIEYWAFEITQGE